MNLSLVASIAGPGFWVEGDGSHSLRVGVEEGGKSRLDALRSRLHKKGFKSRQTGHGKNVSLRVWN